MGAIALVLCASAVPGRAHADWTPPTGATGWCTGLAGGATACYGDPVSACFRQFQAIGGPGPFIGANDSDHWWRKYCSWNWTLGYSLPGPVDYSCLSGYTRVPAGICVLSTENFESCGCDNGGTRQAATPFPIGILDGSKRFRSEDFSLAGGQLAVERYFSSRPAGAAGNTLIGAPLGFGNWRLGLAPELHLGDDWEFSGIAGLSTPEGGHFRFTKSGTSMVATTSTTYPVKHTDYTLEFVGTWPATNTDVKKNKSSWIVRDAQSRVWYLDSQYNPRTARFDIARPVRMVEPEGLEYAYAYADGALVSVTDSYGRSLTFEWTLVGGSPAAISTITLPDGTTLNYVYGAISASATTPDRLIRVERRQGATVLDQTSYDYDNEQFPTFVTGVRDKDNVLRWSVTYDASGRATASFGPGGTQSYSVAYGLAGSTFTRTVTSPLGKSAVYTFTRTGSNYNVKLTSVAEQASPNSPARTTSATFSASNYVATEVDAENRTTGYTRDTSARPTQVVEAQGSAVARTTNITWHSVRNAPTQTLAPGLTTDDSYAAASSAGLPPDLVYAASQAFAYSGAAATYVVPGGVTTATVRLWGGAGGTWNTSASAWSGAGGYVEATFSVAPGDTLTFEVAGGGQGAIVSGPGGPGGWPDGGPGSDGTYATGGGGGSTRLYINNALKAVAGGGGGSGGFSSSGAAGAGGGLVGQSAVSGGGTGGSQTAGGVDSNATTNVNRTGRSLVAYPGAQRTGGLGDGGGGGGGGYWGGGGGGGTRQSGGGGSSWIDPSATAVQMRSGYWPTPFATPSSQPTVATGVFNGTTAAAVKGGDGYATVGLR